MKTTVIYHKADFDGIFCREIAQKYLENADLIGWDYGDPTPDVKTQTLYMVDISVQGLMNFPGLVWVDHHKSAIEKFGPHEGFQLDGVAACRLLWQYFNMQRPTLQQFKDRKVDEPWAVRLAGEYDIWDRRDPDAELFQHGLRSQELTKQDWSYLLSHSGNHLVKQLLGNGKAIQFARTKENESIIRNQGFDLKFEGLNFLACNAARYNSQLFTAGLRPDHDACFGFNWDGPKSKWKVSLYHAPGKEHHDLSQIAVKFGGGGHRGACGFFVDKLPFMP